MVSFKLTLSGVKYNENKTAIIGTVNVVTANWGSNPGFDALILAQGHEDSIAGPQVGLDSKIAHIGPDKLTETLDFHFFVDETKPTHVVVARLVHNTTNQVLREVTQTVGGGGLSGILKYVLIGGALLLVVGGKKLKW